ncbi:hypothetical protein GCM10028796_31480 [Ramlibacter monticola]|uniref:Uncharacterized protein n=1 Tax=Ramlibacter monticola TaxID=1926872 RepID=A0A937CW90_9BURK|nr:DUF6804 family protein [Ramlibacter monticola]MBL0394279.1 hypothetical protein [Ramlibacter monticola]
MPKPIVYLLALLLGVGALPLPYGYYIFLRLVAFLGFGISAYVAYTRKHGVLPWAYGVLAVIFNPFVKVFFPKSVWAAIDLAAALLILVTAKHITTGSSR